MPVALNRLESHAFPLHSNSWLLSADLELMERLLSAPYLHCVCVRTCTCVCVCVCMCGVCAVFLPPSVSLFICGRRVPRRCLFGWVHLCGNPQWGEKQHWQTLAPAKPDNEVLTFSCQLSNPQRTFPSRYDERVRAYNMYFFAKANLWLYLRWTVSMYKAKHPLSYLPLICRVHGPRNLATVDDALSICSCRVDTDTQTLTHTERKKSACTDTHIQWVVSGTAGVASLQMAGAAHTLPVVIQYVLYNSGEQQAPSRYMED